MRTPRSSSSTIHNGKRVRLSSERTLFRLPKAQTSLADYPVVDMHEVCVTHGIENTPADLLLAGSKNPVRLSGMVLSHDQKLLLRLPEVSGFAVEDGEHGLLGNCNLFALGACCWYKICSAAVAFQPMLANMHTEARIYWILRDARSEWMESVHQVMEDNYKHLLDPASKDFTKAQELVAASLEYKFQRCDQSHWRKVHQLLDSECKEPNWHAGFELGAKYIKYLLNHMITDHAELLWKGSWTFSNLGRRDVMARNAVYEMHDLPLPVTLVRFPPTRSIQPELNEGDAPAMSRVERRAESIRSSNRAYRKMEEDGASTVASQSSELNLSITKSETNHKRKWDSRSPEMATTVQSQFSKSSTGRIKQLLGSIFKKDVRPGISTPQTTEFTGSRIVYLKLPDSMRKSAIPATTMAADQPVSMILDTQVDIVTSNNRSTIPLLNNIRSAVPVERYSARTRSKRPFGQIVGRNITQSAVTLEILHSLLYEPGVEDLSIQDMMYVWMRDFGERQEKVIALITCHLKDLLEGLTIMELEAPSGRHEKVTPQNVWRSTTIYDQLYKLYHINDQDSDLIALVDWESEDMFSALGQVEGTWFAKDDTLLKDRLIEPRRAVVVIDLAKNAGIDKTALTDRDHDEVTPKGRQSTENNRSRPVLRRTSRSLLGGGYARDTHSHMKRSPSRSASQVSDHDDESTTSSDSPSEGSGESEVDESVRVSRAWWDITDSQETLEPFPTEPAPKLDPMIGYKVIRGPNTRANNAGIWRCRVPNCFFFREKAQTSESQEVILNHYNMHADAVSDRAELTPEVLEGQNTRAIALRRKLEQEAVDWRRAMESDAFVLG